MIGQWPAVRMRVAAEQVSCTTNLPREWDSTCGRAGRRSPHLQSKTDSTHRYAQSRLHRLRPLPRTRGGRRPAAVSEPGGRGRPPERLHRWRERAADCWRTVSASSGRPRRVLPRWRSGRLMATTSVVSFSSHCLSSCLSLCLSVCESTCWWLVHRFSRMQRLLQLVYLLYI